MSTEIGLSVFQLTIGTASLLLSAIGVYYSKNKLENNQESIISLNNFLYFWAAAPIIAGIIIIYIIGHITPPSSAGHTIEVPGATPQTETKATKQNPSTTLPPDRRLAALNNWQSRLTGSTTRLHIPTAVINDNNFAPDYGLTDDLIDSLREAGFNIATDASKAAILIELSDIDVPDRKLSKPPVKGNIWTASVSLNLRVEGFDGEVFYTTKIRGEGHDDKDEVAIKKAFSDLMNNTTLQLKHLACIR